MGFLKDLFRKSTKPAQSAPEKAPAPDGFFTLEFHFKNRRETNLNEINEALAQHALSDLELMEYSGYLATQTTIKPDTGERTVRYWYGLDDCILRCTPAAADDRFIYQISTMTTEKMEESYSARWREENPGRTMRTMIQLEYENRAAVIVLHHEKKESAEPAQAGTCGEGMTWRQVDDVLYIEGEGEIEEYAFYDDSTIRKVVVAPGCIGIGEAAFELCGELKEVVLPDGLMSIGEEAFESCAALTEIELPDGLQRIGKDAFRCCEELVISVPDSVTEIGKEAFWCVERLIYRGPAQDEENDEWGARNSYRINGWGIKGNTLYICAEGETPTEEVLVKGWHPMANECQMLSPWRDEWKRIEHVVIEPGCTRISAQAFIGCSELETITIPDTVESIGKMAFLGCRKLRSIDLPDGITVIEEDAFKECESLIHVRIPFGMKEIRENTFNGCTNLAQVHIPESVTSIKNGAFFKCSALKQVVLPKGVTHIGQDAFERCSALEAVEIPGGVKVISGGMFSGCTALTRVFLEHGVEKIEWSAFFGCSQLKEIVIPASVTEIAGSALGRVGLDAVWRLHPNNPRYEIVNGLLIDKVNKILIHCLNEIKGKYCIPSGFAEIGEYAFFHQSGLTGVTIPDGVKVIGSDAFSRTGLFFADIPKSVEKIESSAFSHCTNLCSVKIPGSVKELSRFTFQHCTMLASVEIGEGVVKLDGSVFNGCPNLRSIDLPGSVKHIDSYAFSEMENLSAIRIANAEGTDEISFVSSDGVLFSADMRQLVRCPQAKEGTYQVPDGVEVIDAHAFSGCKHLTEIHLPESVRGIGTYAFLDCSALSSLRIPDGVNHIGYEAFKGVAHIVCHSPSLNAAWVWGARSRN